MNHTNTAPLAHPSIISYSESHGPRLKLILTALREQGKQIVFTNGCFDILHPGHVDLLQRARAEGDVLVLGLNSDASVHRQGKGPGRPVNTFAARAFVLAHLGSVDYVVEFDEDTPYELVRIVQPDVLIKGGDWTPERIVGRDVVEAKGGRVLSLPLIKGFSTTGIIERILKAQPAGSSPGNKPR